MLSIRYSDPPETDAETKARKDSGEAEPKDNYDITDYVQKLTWSGDTDQAARKLDFTIAYNTPEKDKTFTQLDLKVGGFIYLFYRENDTADELNIFQGRIFYRKRVTDGYSFDFSCFDDLIYVANGASGSPSVSLTTTQANSAIVVIVSDWNAGSGTQTFTNNFSGTPTALTDYPGDGARYGVAIAYFPDAGAVGSKTVGMSAPTGQKWTIIAIEVKGAS